MRHQNGAHPRHNKLQFPIIPFNKIPIHLQPKHIQTKMRNIRVKEPTNRDPPELKTVPEFGEELVLELVQGTVPCVVILGFGVVED